MAMDTGILTTQMEHQMGFAREGNQFLTFTLGEENYGVDILRVQEIKGYTPVTRIPNTPEYIRGVLNLRGTITPIVDLRTKFGMEKLDYSTFTVIVVLVVKNRVVGVVVDAVSDVLNIGEKDIQETPEFGSNIDVSFIKGIGKSGDKLISILDIDKVLSVDDLDQSTVGAKEKNQVGLNVELLEKSFALVAPQGEALVDRFYQRLFEKYPAVRPMFDNTTMAEQKKKLLASLVLVIQNLKHPDKLSGALHQLGEKHVAYGTEPEHYDAVAETLLEVFKEFAGDAWTSETKKAWVDALGAVKSLMLEGAKKPSA
jgi:chemotaxis signal transduction protein/hemoglobin-like flavoprotein